MRIAAVVAVLVASISLVSSFAEESEKSKPSVVMQKKLEYSQNLLSAIMSEDFEEASRNVKLLKTYTRLEEMLRSKKPGYREELDHFGDALDELTTAVDAEDHDRASKAYLDMLASCILCHRVMRSE
jgi:cytochrome c556